MHPTKTERQPSFQCYPNVTPKHNDIDSSKHFLSNIEFENFIQRNFIFVINIFNAD
jgi:hypothetical protein